MIFDVFNFQQNLVCILLVLGVMPRSQEWPHGLGDALPFGCVAYSTQRCPQSVSVQGWLVISFLIVEYSRYQWFEFLVVGIVSSCLMSPAMVHVLVVKTLVVVCAVVVVMPLLIVTASAAH